MVQSIWLEIINGHSFVSGDSHIDEIIREEEEEGIRDKILAIINLEYSLEIFNETINPPTDRKYDGKRFSIEGGFALRNYDQLKELILESGRNPEELVNCDCDFCKSNPTIGKQMFKLFGIRVTAKRVGRNIWGDVGLQNERLRVLYVLLKKIQPLLEKYKIKAKLNLCDVDPNELEGLITSEELEEIDRSEEEDGDQ